MTRVRTIAGTPGAVTGLMFLMTVFANDLSANGYSGCSRQTHNGTAYTVCSVDPKKAQLQLFLADASGKAFRSYKRLEKDLNSRGECLVFGMNAGMYHKDMSPVGLYVENGEERAPVNTDDDTGNFFLKPNGIFFIKNGKAGVLETNAYKRRKRTPDLASQSGPMLVIDGKIHPRFIVDSPYRKRRNGVGVTNDGRVIFAISENKVNFRDFALFFRDQLKSPNALYFDGKISSLYDKEKRRSDRNGTLGPIIGITAKKCGG
ncbi:MAG: phosphodiester glycosidase family protein [Hyphomicrobiales bacterium]